MTLYTRHPGKILYGGVTLFLFVRINPSSVLLSARNFRCTFWYSGKKWFRNICL